MRTQAADANTLMPPRSAAVLTEAEKAVFRTFYEQLQEPVARLQPIQNPDYQVVLTWTAYKFPDSVNRIGVSGTFDKIYINYKTTQAASIYDYLQDCEIIINTSTANIGNDPVKNNNIRNHFFRFFTPVIHGQVLNVNEHTKKATVRFTLNGIAREVLFSIAEVNKDLIFTGTLPDINAFGAQPALNALQTVCGELHQNKVWPDISLRAEIKNFRNFRR
jgi:hypothetical protein